MAIDETTANYLQTIANEIAYISENLNTMGVSAAPTDGLSALRAKILDIPHRQGIISDSWLPVNNCTEFTIDNLTFLPAKISMSCDAVLERGENMVVQNTKLVAILNVDFPLNSSQIMELNSSKKLVLNTFTSDVTATLTENADGTYSVTLSLEELNAQGGTQYAFKGGYTHNWVLTDGEWFSE